MGAKHLRIRLLTLTGFAAATITVLVYLHVQQRAAWTIAVDGLLSGLYFSGVFAVGWFGGLWIYSLPPAIRCSPVLALMSGFNAGLISWLGIYLLWLVPFVHAWNDIALVINSNLIFTIGVVMNKVPIYHIPSDETDEKHRSERMDSTTL